MLGKHCLKSWSVNQGYIALSSGEAEYYGAVKGGAQALGLVAMMRDMGVEASIDVAVKPGIELCLDASAAVGIALRGGRMSSELPLVSAELGRSGSGELAGACGHESGGDAC